MTSTRHGARGCMRSAARPWIQSPRSPSRRAASSSPCSRPIRSRTSSRTIYAKRLIDAEFAVAGYDIDPARRARLHEIGGTPMDSIAALAKPARCIIIAVFSTDQVEDVIENHLLPALGDGSNKIVLCMSTCDPDRIAALAARVIPRGIRYLDVPVSGTSGQVRRGDGVALMGGDPTIAEDARDVLDALFARRFHVGAVGDGGRAKLAVN